MVKFLGWRVLAPSKQTEAFTEVVSYLKSYQRMRKFKNRSPNWLIQHQQGTLRYIFLCVKMGFFAKKWLHTKIRGQKNTSLTIKHHSKLADGDRAHLKLNLQKKELTDHFQCDLLVFE